MILKKVCPNLKECSFVSNDYSGFNQQKFIDDYTGVKLDLERNEDVNMMFSKIFTTLLDCGERHVPLKKMSKKSLKFKTKPWISTCIKKLIAYRDRLLRKYTRTKRKDDHDLYGKFRNSIVAENRKSKASYFKNYFATHILGT